VQTLQHIAETTSADVLERDFSLDGLIVTAWSPASLVGTAPLVLMGTVAVGTARRRRWWAAPGAFSKAVTS
jgi:hypothetical protein